MPAATHKTSVRFAHSIPPTICFVLLRRTCILRAPPAYEAAGGHGFVGLSRRHRQPDNAERGVVTWGKIGFSGRVIAQGRPKLGGPCAVIRVRRPILHKVPTEYDVRGSTVCPRYCRLNKLLLDNAAGRRRLRRLLTRMKLACGKHFGRPCAVNLPRRTILHKVRSEADRICPDLHRGRSAELSNTSYWVPSNRGSND